MGANRYDVAMKSWNQIAIALKGKEVTLPDANNCAGTGGFLSLKVAEFEVPSANGFKFHANITIEGTISRLDGGWQADYDTWRIARTALNRDLMCEDAGVVTISADTAITFGYEANNCGPHMLRLLVRSGDASSGKFSGVKVKIKEIVLTAIVGDDGGVVELGCAGCGSGSGANSHTLASGNYEVASVQFALPMGRPGPTSTNGSVGAMYIHEATACNELFTPACLKLTPSYHYEDVVLDTNGWIRQVKVSEGLADIVVGSTNVYEIKVYGRSNVLSKSGGLWVVTNSPSATYKIERIGSMVLRCFPWLGADSLRGA